MQGWFGLRVHRLALSADGDATLLYDDPRQTWVVRILQVQAEFELLVGGHVMTPMLLSQESLAKFILYRHKMGLGCRYIGIAQSCMVYILCKVG